MTYCAAIKVSDGLVDLTDGHLTSDTQVTAGRKITLHDEGHQFFVAT